MPLTPWQCHSFARTIAAGGIVAYPTEAVWGLGCNPGDAHAVNRLLTLKRRPLEKGLILIAADLVQLEPWIAPLTSQQRATLERPGPKPITWLVPAAPDTPPWLTGRHPGLAVRITQHPMSRDLCAAAATALVSTSANPSGRLPATTALGVRRYFGSQLDMLVPGRCGGQKRPSEIRDLVTRALIRAG